MCAWRNRFGAPLSLILLSGVPVWGQAPSVSPSTAPAEITKPPNAIAAEPGKKSVEPPSPLNAATDLFRDGKVGEAEAAYHAIIQSDSKSAAAYVGLFRVLLREKRLADAAVAVTKATELAANSDAVHVAQGELH